MYARIYLAIYAANIASRIRIKEGKFCPKEALVLPLFTWPGRCSVWKYTISVSTQTLEITRNIWPKFPYNSLRALQAVLYITYDCLHGGCRLELKMASKLHPWAYIARAGDVYTYMYICTHIHAWSIACTVCSFTHSLTHTSTYTHTYTLTTHTHTHTHSHNPHTHTHTCTIAWIGLHVRSFMHSLTFTHIHNPHILTHTHTHLHNKKLIIYEFHQSMYIHVHVRLGVTCANMYMYMWNGNCTSCRHHYQQRLHRQYMEN